MGCAISAPKTGIREPLLVDEYEEEVENFLLHRTTLDDLWNAFNEDHGGIMSLKEFDHLVFITMIYFCKLRNPHKVHTRAEMGTIIDQAVSGLHRYMRAKNHNRVTRTEFEHFGTFLTTEYNRLAKELNLDGGRNKK